MWMMPLRFQSCKMEEITIKLPGGVTKSVPKGTRFQELAKGSAEDAVAVQLDGVFADLSRPMEKDASISFVSVHSKRGLEILRHSAAHVMAQAVKELFPGAKLTFGPATETGFYYDFDFDRTFTPQDLELIEKKMSEIVHQDLPFVRTEVLKEEAMQAGIRGYLVKPFDLKQLEEAISVGGCISPIAHQ